MLDFVNYCDKVNTICKPLFKHIAIKRFAYIELQEDGKYSILSSESSFFEEYINLGYHKKCPLNMLSLYGTQGYYVSDYYYCHESVLSIQNRWKEFLNNFDYGHSLFITHQDMIDNSIVYKFYIYDADIRNKGINHEYINNLDTLNKFNKYFSENISNLLNTIIPTSVDLEYQNEFKSLWLNALCQLAEKSSNNFKIISSLIKSNTSTNQPSPREMEAFHW